MQPNDTNPTPTPEELPKTPSPQPDPATQQTVVSEAPTDPSSAAPVYAAQTPEVTQPSNGYSETINLPPTNPADAATAASPTSQVAENQAGVATPPATPTPDMAVPATAAVPTPGAIPTISQTQTTPQVMMSPQVTTNTTVGNQEQLNSNPNDLFGKKAKKKKIFIMSGLVALFFVALSSAYVFGFYLPNTPDNVWKTGLSRTGKEVEAIANKISDPESFSTLAKNKVTISGSVDFPDQKVTIDFDSNFDELKSDNNLDIGVNSSALQEPINVNAKIKTSLPENSVWPNVFFNISGLSSLGFDAFLPGISAYEGKWISVEQDFYEKYLDELTSGNESSNITEQDVISVMNDVVAVSQDYLFSSDPEKAVINQDEFIGEEESEGITAFRYKASVNETNAEKFCIALIDKLYTNESFKKINQTEQSDLEKAIEDAKKGCSTTQEEDDDAAEPETFDLWIDKKYKILHKIRFSEDLEAKAQSLKDQKAGCIQRYSDFGSSSSSTSFCDYYDDLAETGEKYVDVGQIYKGEDEFALFVNQVTNTNRQNNSIRGDFSINAKDLSINGSITYKDNSEDSRGSANISIKTEPFDGEIDANKPEGAVPLQQVIDDLTNQQAQSFQLGASTGDENELEEENTSEFNYYQQLKIFLELFTI